MGRREKEEEGIVVRVYRMRKKEEKNFIFRMGRERVGGNDG